MNKLITLIAAFAVLTVSAATDYEKLVKFAESTDGKAPIASIWQKQNETALARAVRPEALAAVVADAAVARVLLEHVGTAYSTDSLVAYKIAEVTHYVMIDADAPWYAFGRANHDAERQLWTEALLARAETSQDIYVKLFCLDQLRWCAYPCQAERIRLIGGPQAPKGVREMADLVARELAR